MTFYINGRFLCQPVTGVQRYALQLVRSLDSVLCEAEYEKLNIKCIIIVPNDIKVLPVYNKISIKKVGIFAGHFWEQVELPFYCNGGILFNPCNTAPLFKRSQIVTLHDASVFRVPDAYSLSFRLWYKALFFVTGKIALSLLTISKFSRDELVACCRIKNEKFDIIYEGADHFYYDKANIVHNSKFYDALSKPYVLAVSSMSPHKNFRAFVEAITLIGDMDFNVIIAGGTNPAIFKSADIQLPGLVQHVGYVSDEELKMLYSNASCFIYPSLYEGFGLPPLEAMSNGCPVIAARAGSLPEVCGDAALFCDPQNPQDIADKIQLLMRNAKLREEFREKGLAHAKLFTWEKCARETLTVIKKVLNK